MSQRRQQFIKNLPSVQTYTATRAQTALTGLNNFSSHASDQKQHSLRKSNSLAQTSKVVSYETTGLIYMKKREQESRKLQALKRQIQQIQQQIEHRRRQIGQKKRTKQGIIKPQVDTYLTYVEEQEDKVSYRKNINMNNPQQLKAEVALVNKKLADMKKKLDSLLGQNRNIQSEIDVFRREVVMFNQLNASLDLQKQKRSNQFQQVFMNSKMINEDVMMKHDELAKRKISKVHQEVKLIKQYDEVLKTVEKEMEMDRLKSLAGQKPNFYMTQVNMSESKSPLRKVTPSSPTRRRRMASKPLSQLNNQLKNYQQMFRKIREEAGTDNIDLLAQKHREQYQQNYRLYLYINNMNDQLSRQHQEQLTLKQKLKEVQLQARDNFTQVREKQIAQTRQELKKVQNKKNNYDSQIKQYNKTIKDLKLSIPALLNRLNIQPQQLESSGININKIEDVQLLTIMTMIEKRKKQMMKKIEMSTLSQKPNIKMTLDEMEQLIEAAQKQFNAYNKNEENRRGMKDSETRYSKFMDKEEMLRGLQDTHKFKKLRLKNKN